MKYHILFLCSLLTAHSALFAAPAAVAPNGTGISNPDFRNAVLPSQTSNSGKYLKTDGAAATWESVTADLSSGPVTSSGGVSAIADGALSIAKTNGLQTALDAKLSAGSASASGLAVLTGTPTQARESIGLDDPASVASVFNGQPSVAKKLATYETGSNGTGSPPIRVFFYGDSYVSGMELPSNVATRGNMKLGYVNVSGPVLVANTSDFTHWVNGMTTTHPVGSVANLTTGGSSGDPGYVQGDKCYIAYIKSPGVGSFKLQSNSSLAATTAWVDIATIDTQNEGGEIGAFNEYSLDSSNYPYYRLRITDVTGKALIRVGAGIYNSDGGGALSILLGAENSNSPFQNVVTSAILNPIWSGLAPDMVLSCYREDDHTQWNVGGAYDNFYLATKALKEDTDWLLVGMNPAADETFYPAMMSAQKAWAIRNKESWFNPYNLFRDYTTGVARGMISDTMHLSAAGKQMRNAALWSEQPLGRYPLGGFAGDKGYLPQLAVDGRPAKLGMQAITCNKSFAIRSTMANSGELEIWDVAAPNSFPSAFRLRASASSFWFKAASEDVFEVNYRYTKLHRGVVYNKAVFTATATNPTVLFFYAWQHTLLVDATTNPVSIAAGSTAASMDGRVHVIKKIDASANAVTFYPYGSPGQEKVEGANTVVLPNQWDYVILQTHGGNYIKIGGNI